ncbi:folylpolyglutamate synthase/dihydrofolate synthase family protein [Roseivirga sp. UBA838]|uniref:bifunctional folylpolyglutamate synthase/dihydrofolate synthase n=1 Tax=Roseivirga sp. UBA838 TaxID=1947393 RepID=UPI00257AC841|nr:folylpolyglutamate synthase/dihydrofolate synthase family protein [Roseivirga sp. UBA838]|tara:strand:+ start:257 stop:1483 length:1227 start_codon:yes stop_codon:yes gene_type:complete
MTYQEALDYMFKALPMYQRVGQSAFKKDLTNTLKLCNALGNPQQKFKSIHVAGTNGKGSTSHMLASVLQSAGYKTGLYTSPHLKSFTERIRLNGKEAEQDFVINFIKKHKKLIEEIKPSFFEITVVMAFEYFAQKKVEVAVIEVGLGGRLDSTNVIRPELSIITNIGFDHMELLGDTLAKIAMEKAGIIKENVPVVITEKQADTVPVFTQIANNRNAPITFAEEVQFDAIPLSDLKGNYQAKNVRGVLTALDILRTAGWKISDEAIHLGLQNVQANTGLKGRWQQIGSHPLTICDTGHNKEAFEYIVRQIQRELFDQLYMVLGFVKEKDLKPILNMLPEDAVLIFCEPQIPRALLLEELRERTQYMKQTRYYIQDVNRAIAKARSLASEGDMIYIGGSTFVVAEIEEL